MNEKAVPQSPVYNEVNNVGNIFCLLKKGWSCNNIADDFNKKSIPAPMGGLWTSTTVRRIAENPIYAGIVIIGKTKREYNPLTETHYDAPVPPEKWVWFEDPILKPYMIISPEDWIKIQIRLWNIARKSRRRGRPAAEFGPSVLSGMLFCAYCGAPLVSGRGSSPRCFRCANRRLKTGNPNRCDFSFTIREDTFIIILARIIDDIIRAMYHDSIRILNDEFKKAGEGVRKSLAKKEREYRECCSQENSLLEFYEEAKRRGINDIFEQYFSRATVLRDKIVDLEQELKAYRDANEFALKPMELDPELFDQKLAELENILTSASDVTELRTAIKCFLPKIFITSEDVEGQYRILTFRIDEIPAGLPDMLKEEHRCIIELKKSKNDCRKAIVESDEFFSDQGKNYFQSMYDNLSNRYVSDNKSYGTKTLVPRYWNVLIPFVGKKLSNWFVFSLPFVVETFGFDNYKEKLY